MSYIRYAVLVAACTMGLYGASCAQPAGYSFGREITIPATSGIGVAGDLTDFPLLFSFQDNDLRTTGNGGNVENTNGYDIIFTSDCLTQLDHQIESYTATNGTYIAWVRIPTLSASENTVIYMYYGNASAGSDPSVTSVWDSGYEGVWHFASNVLDASANGNNLQDNPSNASSDFTGKIGTSRDLNNNTNVVSSSGGGEYLRVPNGMFSGMTDFTFEGWVFLDRNNTFWERVFDFGQSTTVNFFFTISNDDDSPAQTRARITVNGNVNEQGPFVANSTVTTGAWIHWAVVVDNAASTMTIYRDGNSYGTPSTTVTLTPGDLEASTANYLGRSQYAPDHYIDAKFDEFRISSAPRSADWILASYENQNAPASFFSVSAEMTAGDICALPIVLLSFTAAAREDKVLVEWTTASEQHNDFFVVERSADGAGWEGIARIEGAGNSDRPIGYEAWDDHPLPGLGYYRLKQTDYDGTVTYSQIRVVKRERAFKVYPNPAAGRFTVEVPSDEVLAIKLVNALGQEVAAEVTMEGNKFIVNVSSLGRGIYYLYVAYPEKAETQLISIR